MAGRKLPKQELQWSVEEPGLDAEPAAVLHWLIACMCQHDPALRPTALALVQQVPTSSWCMLFDGRIRRMRRMWHWSASVQIC